MKRRSSRAAYYYPKPEPNALERILNEILGTGPLSPDYAERGLQLRYRNAMAPWGLMLALALLGLGGLAYGLWKLVEAALMRGPMGRVYAASRAVRRQLLKTRKASTRLPPTPEALEAAWAKSRRSLEWKLRLGSMLEDLEPAVDQSYIRDDEGAIVGREAGIRGWLMEHCVEVFDHYKTAMGYKALAHRFRLAIDLPEPFTLEDVLDALSESIENIEKKEKVEQEARRTKVKNSDKCAAAEAAAGVAAEEAPKAPREDAAEGEAGASTGASEGPREYAAEGVKCGASRTTDATSGTTGAAKESARNNQNVVVLKACEEAEKIVGALRKRNQKKGRPMGRSMGSLDEILHGKLKLLNVPRSA